TNFGFAKEIRSTHANQNGAALGNPKYISPEQVKGAEALDHRSDLYSIGAVLYEMLAGRAPFNSPSQFELMLAHVNQQPEPPGKFNSTIPTALDAAVLKALEKSPAARYQSAGEFDQALAQVVVSVAEPSTPEPLAAPEIAVAPAVAFAETAQAGPEPAGASGILAFDSEAVAAAAPVEVASEAAPATEVGAADIEVEPAPVVDATAPVVVVADAPAAVAAAAVAVEVGADAV